jgi:hypothetical protein
MIKAMINRWIAIGRPIFMIPKDFKERILTSDMDQQIRLNYFKWLTQGLEIDMFEILSILTLYSRGSILQRLKQIFTIYCIKEFETMTNDEFRFLIGKLSTSIGSTLALNKTVMHEAVKNIEPRIIPDQATVTEEEFLPIMMGLFKDFSNKVGDFNQRLDIFTAAISKDRLPSYLKPGQKFLGKYQIEQVISYQDIIKNNAMT